MGDTGGDQLRRAVGPDQDAAHVRVLVEILDRPVAARDDHRVIGVHVDFRQDLRLLQPRRAAGVDRRRDPARRRDVDLKAGLDQGFVDDDELLGPDAALIDRAVASGPFVRADRTIRMRVITAFRLAWLGDGAQMFWPPETSMRWAVTQRLSGPSRLATAGPMSSGTPTRPSAVIVAKASL